MTPSQAIYDTDGNLQDITYNRYGDGTVQYFSSQGLAIDDTSQWLSGTMSISGSILYKDFTSNHTSLVQDSSVLTFVNAVISSDGTAAISASSDAVATIDDAASATMEGMLRIRYKADVPVTVSVLDASGTEVASIAENVGTGFTENNFVFDNWSDDETASEATIYIDATGYTLSFRYGTEEGVDTNFEITISTLDADGNYDFSIYEVAAQTAGDGLLFELNGVENYVNNDTIIEMFPLAVTYDYYTDWAIADTTLSMDLGDVYTILLTGGEASLVCDSLIWYSSDESVVSVSAEGVLSAAGYGTAVVYASNGSKQQACSITVVLHASAVEFSAVDMVVGERVLVKPTFTPAATTETAMSYTLSEEGIVEINDSGVILALAVGSVTVTGTAENGVKNSFVVTVTKRTVAVEEVLLGDIDGNEIVSIHDAILAAQAAENNGAALTADAFTRADIDGDGEITQTDFACILALVLE